MRGECGLVSMKGMRWFERDVGGPASSVERRHKTKGLVTKTGLFYMNLSWGEIDSNCRPMD